MQSTDNGKFNFYYNRSVFLERSTGWSDIKYSEYIIQYKSKNIES